ncbi:TolC family protein [Clostridium beijerinckii]|uniref:ElaB/YqjD/DUF883 family membrane-anchored ribosome-binding protein n=1 Tax=Clostridium beijerinckii TaxID=1520 RepID=A0AAE5H731_CLOBE|nr:TolC family protein [Clostridium beijerinckii]NSB15676.1 ElaB/YqjD/DUF883 family membrane-anchored ribosome-binding protein [Clostridium beijerinckii]OOM33538.1 outer membrane efflux protein [Clostridium beijerinckii]
MRRIFISFLIGTLVASSSISMINIPSAYADTTDNSTINEVSDSGTIKVSLENIRDIITENNLDIKIKQNNLKIAQEEYHDALDDYDSAKSAYDAYSDKEDIESNYESAKNAYENSPDDATLKAAYDTAKSAYDAKNAYDNADTTLTTKRDAFKTARDDYNKEIEDQVYAAQQAYITYLSDLPNEKIKEDTVNINTKKEQIYKLQYDSGFISKNKYTELLQGNTSVDDLDSSKNTADLDKLKLFNLLGISSGSKVTFENDIDKNFDVISKINYEDDLSKMLENNIDIKLQNDEIDDLDDAEDDYDNKDIYDNKVEEANNKLKSLMNSTETSFKKQYNDLMTSYNSIKSSYDVINQKQKEYEIEQTKYDYGFVSKNDVDAAKLTLDNDNADFINKRNQCYLSYLKYIEMKEGY